MDILITTELINCLLISMVVSVINMVLVQKFKELSFVKKDDHIFILNLIFSFVVGIPFSIIFYKLEVYYSVWVAVFSFVGASNIYDVLKKQTIIKYTPFRISDKYTNDE